MIKKLGFLILVIGCFCSCSTSKKMDPADLVLKNGEIYTMEAGQAWASAIIITGNKITAVLDSSEKVTPYIGDKTKVIDLNGKFVVPGFIDGHVHFNRAGELINDANLMKISSNEGLQKEMARVVKLLDDGEWVTGGLWGAYEQWALSSAKAQKKKETRWKPSREVIDNITGNNPCLLNSFDYELFLANSLALIAAGLEKGSLPGMKLDKNKIPTGLIYKGSPALDKIKKVIKKKSDKRLMDENRAALKHLAKCGIVEIHDIARPEQTARFLKLEESGELTSRVWLRPDLSRDVEIIDNFKMGIHPGSKQPSSWLRYGALKGYIDGIMGTHGALFFKPYDDQPENYGHYRRHTSDDPTFKIGNMDKMYSLIKKGYSRGFVSNVHAIGTKGVALMLDTYERLSKDLGKDLAGFRIIHAQVIRPDDFPRFKKLNVIAEINPYHVSDDMRWMEERIGHERCKGAYAFKSLLDNGAILSFGSDWPGTSAAEYHCHPKYLIHAAVNRTTLDGKPKEGWFPEQKISVHEALKAFTINNAYAAFEDKIRGSLKEGKLADIAVCDKNLIKMDPKDILTMNVTMTIVDGKIVYKTN